jgi:tRNA (guanine-N7-)-methyltransferase
MARQKTFRKTDFHTLPNCFDRENAAALPAFLPPGQPLTLELGCGKADFSLEMARRYPERSFVGVDIKRDRLWVAARRALESGLGNLAFVHAHLIELASLLPPASAEQVWITFPDPFPKNRHAKHRMINPPFLAQYRQLLLPGGQVHFKTDNLPLFHYSLETFVQMGGLRFRRLSFDLHAQASPEADERVLTAYERRFMAEGLPINYVCFSFEAEDPGAPKA